MSPAFSKVGRTILREGRKVYAADELARDLKRKADRNRLQSVGLAVLNGVQVMTPQNAVVTIGETTSGQPLIRIDYPDGVSFHCTVARARK